MADLDFKHTVQQIPAGEQLPGPLPRTESVKVVQNPDFQTAVSTYASDSNWLSTLGSAVASRASNEIALKIGGELGKNPQGDIGIPLTEFDQTMQKSYEAQSQSTLGLQAQKLITQSNIELASAPRINHEMILKSQEQVGKGLSKIFSLAPSAIKANIEQHYGSVMLNQIEQLTDRMLREQKTDRVDTLANSNKTNLENIHALMMTGPLDKNGESLGALAAIKALNQDVDAAAARNDITKSAAQEQKDAAMATYLSGKYSRQAIEHEKNKTLPAFMKSMADNDFKIPDKYHDAVYQNTLATIQQHQTLRSQEEQLNIAKFNTTLARDIASAPQALSILKGLVSPLEAEKAELRYLNALKADQQTTYTVQQISAGWNNSEKFAHFSDKGIDKTFDILTQKYETSNPEISHEDAQVIVAASAGAKVPIFNKILEDELTSGNPINIEKASRQMQLLNTMEAARAYSGVSQKAKAIAYQFQSQRGSMPDTDLARKITDNLTNLDEATQKALDHAWGLELTRGQAGGLGASKSFASFALKEMGLGNKIDQFGGKYFETLYGNDLYNQLQSNFVTARGDYATAKKMTLDYYNEHYGETTINGMKQITDSPIEKYLGYTGHDVTPYIQQDLLSQLDTAFNKPMIATKDKEGKETLISQKEAYNKNLTTEYWETLPLKGNTAEVIRHIKTKEGTKTYRYPVNLVGRAGNQWDVSVNTPYGQRNLFLIAPHVGVTTYSPNKADIDKRYKERPKKGWLL